VFFSALCANVDPYFGQDSAANIVLLRSVRFIDSIKFILPSLDARNELPFGQFIWSGKTETCTHCSFEIS
jgi:hypothetical protein